MESERLTLLLSRAKRRDRAALDELLAAYAPRVFGLLVRLLGSRDRAEELTQETFLRLVRNIEDYEHNGRFEAWLFRIAANLARDHIRRIKRRGVPLSLNGGADDDTPTEDPSDSTAPAPDAALMNDEMVQRLNEGLARLSEADREIIMLRHFSELSFNEIAALLEIPRGTALARAHRALKKLRIDMGGAE